MNRLYTCSRRRLLVAGLLISTLTGWRSERVVTAESAEQLAAALSRARPGDEIMLTDGVYAGDFSLHNSGTAQLPIVIRAARPHRAVLTSQLVLKGSFAIVFELGFEGGHVEVHGDDCRVLRCRLYRTGNQAIRIDGTARRAEIAYNRIERYGATAAGEEGRGISVQMTAKAWPTHPWIPHNHILDHAAKNGGAIHCGAHRSHTNNPIDMLAEYNLIERSQASTILGCKASNITYRFNTVRDCSRPSQSRHGRNCQWIGNAFLNSSSIRLRGFGHTMIGNYKDGGPSGMNHDFVAASGSVTQDAFATSRMKTAHPAAESCLLVGNLGPVWIGGGFETDPLVKARNNRVEAAKGPVTLVANRQIDTTESRVTTLAIPSYVIVGRDEVGPFA